MGGQDRSGVLEAIGSSWHLHSLEVTDAAQVLAGGVWHGPGVEMGPAVALQGRAHAPERAGTGKAREDTALGSRPGSSMHLTKHLGSQFPRL